MAGSPRDRATGIAVRDLLATSIEGVRLHRLRSGLIVASFAAGVASALGLEGVTTGARAQLLAQIESMGTDVVAIREIGERAKGKPPGVTIGDATALRKSFPFVREIAPVRMMDAAVQLENRRMAVKVIGTSEAYFQLQNARFDRGRGFSRYDLDSARPVCVAGAIAARAIDSVHDIYGTQVRIGSGWCEIVGVLAVDHGEALIGSSTTGEEARELYVPIQATFRGDLSERQEVRALIVRLDGIVSPEAAARVFERTLRRRHGGTEAFEVVTAQSLLEQRQRARGLLDRLLQVVSFLAFGLGGVSLLSLSWQGVAARSREIAIRRAVGARREEILVQFVLEGLLLASTGAAAGALLGIPGTWIVCRVGGWPWMLSVFEPLKALLWVLIVGALATLYPAFRAATLDPVAALRLER